MHTFFIFPNEFKFNISSNWLEYSNGKYKILNFKNHERINWYSDSKG